MAVTRRHILRQLATTALVLVSLAACNKSDEAAGPETSRLTLLPLTGSYHDNELQGTRALPAGFSVYDPAGVTNIDVFLTSPVEEDKRGMFSNSTGQWTSNIDIANGQLFYIYGYMPKEACVDASVAPIPGGTVVNGAVMTLEGLSPLSTIDVCVVVGAKQGDQQRLPITEVEDLRQGHFSFIGRSAAQGNFVYLLLNHIYASLGFQFRVDATYSELRTIVLKKMQLSTTSASATTATVTLRANNGGEDPIESITWASVAGEKQITIYDDADGQTLTTSYADIHDCVFANIINGDITIVCTYDVYDKAGNLTRANCVTENKLPRMTVANRGERTTLRLTVNPTYLYVLSDADLDNPTLTIE